MADDRRQQPDSTAPMGRLGHNGESAGAAADDATRVRPGLGDQDATRVHPDRVLAASEDAASTMMHPDRVRAAYEDGTRTMPPAAGSDSWAGSASVPRTDGPYQYPDAYPDDIEPQPNWLRPVLFGVIGLLLLGALLTGVWLIFTADDEPPTTTQASPPAASSAPPTTAPTTAPASEPPTSLAPPPIVVVPAELIGLSEDEARRKLTDAGLRVQVTRRTDATMAPGTVLEAFPGPGSEVPPNSLVRLVVAIAPEPSEPRPSGPDED